MLALIHNLKTDIEFIPDLVSRFSLWIRALNT